MLKPQNNRCRTVIELNGFWEYAREMATPPVNGFTPEGKLAVPATWNEQKSSLFHYNKRLWYQKRFTTPRLREGERVFLRFAGIVYRGEFFCNGTRLGEDLLGFLPHEFDITDLLNEEENLIVAGIDGNIAPEQPIGVGDFYVYGGIHRPVTLEIRNAVCFDTLQVKAEASGKVSVRFQASGGTGCRFAVSGTGASAVGSAGEVTFALDKVTPWSPETPALYELKAELFDGDTLCDIYTLRIGFRTVEIKGRKIMLNGKEVKLTGFGKHEDFPVLGKATLPAVYVKDFDLMKWCGANSFRTSHYPYSEEIMELADESGFMVIDESCCVAVPKEKMIVPQVQQNAEDFIRALIARDINHPCVISWSMGNECETQSENALQFFPPVFEAARQADPSRPLTYVAFTGPGIDHIYKYADIIGLNRYFGWYSYPQWGDPCKPGDLKQAVKTLGECLDEYYKLYEKPILLSEFGADCVAGLHSLHTEQFSEEFQAAMVADCIRCVQERDWMAGMHIWCFADFYAMQSPMRVMGNRKGIFTRNRDPKAAAFVVRKLWTKQSGDALYRLNDDEPCGPF